MKQIIKHVAIDVHAESHHVAIASPDGEVRDYGAALGTPGSRFDDLPWHRTRQRHDSGQ